MRNSDTPSEDNRLVIKFDVTPVACARPRLGKFGAYTPKSTHDYKRLLADLLHVELQRNPSFKETIATFYDQPIKMEMIFSMPIPKRLIKKRSEPWRTAHPTTKPDWDNLGKSVGDVLTGQVYRDDSQVVFSSVRKIYDERPYVQIIIEQAK